MSLKYISSAWQTHLKTGSQPSRDNRVFIDFRQKRYISLSEANERYEPVKLDRNRVGSFTYYAFGAYTNLVATNDLSDNTEWDHSATYHTSASALFDQRIRKTVWSWTRGSNTTTTIITDTNNDPGTSGTYSSTLWFYCSVACVVKFGLIHGGGTDYSSTDTTTAGEWNLIKLSVTTANDPTGIEWNITKSGGGNFDNTQIFRACEPVLLKTAYSYPSAGDDLSPGAVQNDYFLPFTQQISGRIIIEPWWSASEANDHYIFKWSIDANRYISLYYNDGYHLDYKGGVNTRTLINGYKPDAAEFYIIDFSIDLTEISPDIIDGGSSSSVGSDILDGGSSSSVGSDIADGNWIGTKTSGSNIWFNRTEASDTWSGAIDESNFNFAKLELGHTGGASHLNGEFIQAFFIPDVLITDADIQDDYKTVLNERVYFDFNGYSWGQTRCKIPASSILRIWQSSFNQKSNGAYGANRISLLLYNAQGEYSDNQTTAFEPENLLYNGSSDQLYLQTRTPVYVENYYSGDWDFKFVGRVDTNFYRRQSSFDNITTVELTCEDIVDLIANKITSLAISFEDYKFSDPDNKDTSLLHAIMRLGMQTGYKNYLGNSSFENTTIANSWTATGGTFVKTAGGLVGSNYGRFIGTGNVAQKVKFLETTVSKSEYLQIGEKWNFQVLARCQGGNPGITMTIEELTAADALISSTSQAHTLPYGGDWELINVVHTVVGTSTPARLRVKITAANYSIFDVDAAMLNRSDKIIYWNIVNANDGTAGVIGSESNESDTYELCGFDADTVDITHPYCVIPEHTSPWMFLQNFAIATQAKYLGIDNNGTIKYRSALTGAEDEIVLNTITSIKNISTSIDNQCYNKIVVRAVNIKKETELRVIWKAANANIFTTEGEVLNETIVDDGYFPDPDTYGEFWVQYNDQVAQLGRG